MKKYKIIFYIILIAIAVFIPRFLRSQYDMYYGYTEAFTKMSEENGFSELVSWGEYYRVFEKDDTYLVLVKNNTNPYLIKKSSGVTKEEVKKMLANQGIPSEEIVLKPDALLVGNSRKKSLEGYLYWFSSTVNSTENRMVFIDFYTGEIEDGVGVNVK